MSCIPASCAFAWKHHCIQTEMITLDSFHLAPVSFSGSGYQELPSLMDYCKE